MLPWRSGALEWKGNSKHGERLGGDYRWRFNGRAERCSAGRAGLSGDGVRKSADRQWFVLALGGGHPRSVWRGGDGDRHALLAVVVYSFPRSPSHACRAKQAAGHAAEWLSLPL